jgi:FKBP-type peptidyl-prolyl cis-trans isomerase FkpA
MRSIASWLLVALLFVNVGCRQSESKSSGAASGETQTSTSSSGSGPGSGASSTGATGSGMSATANSDAAGPVVTTASGLQYQDMVIGTGTEATPGSTASVHYTGWLTDGTQFDSSRGKGQPISFQIGTQYIIQGWNEGITGMKVGGKRKLTIPPSLGYGADGRPPVIPPNATLKFDIELVAVN